MESIIKWCNVNQGFLSAALSLVAVLAAIGIPAFIAHRQNKIALFEKRFEVLKMINKVKQFDDALCPIDLDDGKHSVDFILSIWVTIQRLDFCLYEHISFMPESTLDQAEEIGYFPDIDTINHDTEVMRKQLNVDSYILMQGCPLFPEPLRTGLEQLKIQYSSFILSLLQDHGGTTFSDDTRVSFKQFQKASQEFAIGKRYERMMVGCVKI